MNAIKQKNLRQRAALEAVRNVKHYFPTSIEDPDALRAHIEKRLAQDLEHFARRELSDAAQEAEAQRRIIERKDEKINALEVMNAEKRSQSDAT